MMKDSTRRRTQISKTYRTRRHFRESIIEGLIDAETNSAALIHDCFLNPRYSTPDRRGLYDEA